MNPGGIGGDAFAETTIAERPCTKTVRLANKHSVPELTQLITVLP